jgi:glyoxylase-like metal-dependent hydrolase (beta-lactamase superfamily II)
MSRPHTFKVIDNVYCVMRRSYFTCSYLVDTPTGLVAIDAGMKSTGAEMLSAISELGRKVTDVSAILLTHWHNDHAAGASVLAKLSGAQVFYSADEAAHLTWQSASTGLRGKISAIIPETGPLVLFKGLLGNAPQQPVDATCFIHDGETIQNDFTAIATPGHTSGHMSYYYAPARVLFAGDAVAVINGKLRRMARPTTENLDQARESMLKCLSLPIAAICPGHREPLFTRVASECDRFRDDISAQTSWPILG